MELKSLGSRLTVGQQTLDLFILVRIQASQLRRAPQGDRIPYLA